MSGADVDHLPGAELEIVHAIRPPVPQSIEVQEVRHWLARRAARMPG